MPKRILKFRFTDRIPADHNFLHADVQEGRYFMWLETDADTTFGDSMENPYVRIATGESHDFVAHKATIVDAHSGLVWHVYDKRGPLVFANKGDSEATFVTDGNDVCFACGGSGHAGDVTVPKVNIKCETDNGFITGTTTLNVIRVEREDDGSFTAVTDHWPQR